MFINENLDLSKDFYFLAAPFYNFPNISNKIQKNDSRNERIFPKLQIEFLKEFLNACGNDCGRFLLKNERLFNFIL